MANTRDVMGETAALDALVARTLTDIVDDGVKSVKSSALRYYTTLETIDLPSCTVVNEYGLANCSSLTVASMPLATSVKEYAFQSCPMLKEVDVATTTPGQACFSGCLRLSSLSTGILRSISGNVFQDCKSLSTSNVDLSSVTSIGNYAFGGSGIGALVLPACTSIGTFQNGNRLSVVDIYKNASLSTNRFNGAKSLCHLILRPTGKMSLTGSALTDTAIKAGVGWIYVPTDLVATYKADSTWSTYSSQIVAISEYPKRLQDETVTDSWADIATSVSNGTYSTKYSVGDVKYLDVEGTKVPMVLVAKDTDALAAGGTAATTWISRGVFETFSMNPTTSTSGGWASCDLRSWLRDVILPQVESGARSAIKSVTKTYYDIGASPKTQSVTDTLWIPSAREMFGGTSYEASGCDYTTFFTDNASRVKKGGIGVAGSPVAWTLRSAYTAGSFFAVSINGNAGNNGASSQYGIVFGFCI